MRLARQMGRTLAELLDSIDSHELSLWIAYDRLEPLDDPYWRTGLICSTMANINKDKKTTAFKPDDFIPRQRNQTDQKEAMRNAFRALKNKRKSK